MKKLIKAICMLAAVQRMNILGVDDPAYLQSIAHDYYEWVMNDATD